MTDEAAITAFFVIWIAILLAATALQTVVQ